MTIAEPILRKCPNCSSLIKWHEYLSGNTFGTKHYSDSYIYASMMIPDGMEYIGCPSCKNVNVASKFEVIRRYIKDPERTPGFEALYQNAIEPLPMFETLKILLEDQKFLVEEQKDFLTQYFTKFNHELDTDKKKAEVDSGNYKKYTDKLLTILGKEQNNINSMILMAEIFRERDEFEKAVSILNSIPESASNDFPFDIVEQIKAKAEAHDSKVFELKHREQ